MRVSMSPRGSLTDIDPSSLPARFDEARDEALVAELPDGDARHLHLAIEPARAAGHLTAVSNANRGAVARQRRQLDARLETLLHRTRLVVGDFEQTPAPADVFPHQALLPQIIFNRTLLCHSGLQFFRV